MHVAQERLILSDSLLMPFVSRRLTKLVSFLGTTNWQPGPLEELLISIVKAWLGSTRLCNAFMLPCPNWSTYVSDQAQTNMTCAFIER